MLLTVALTLSIVTVVAPAAKADPEPTPTQSQEQLPNYVKFEGTEEFTIQFRTSGNAPDVNLQYSTDGTIWNDYDNLPRPIISSGENKVVYFRGTNDSFSKDSGSLYNYFEIKPNNNGTVAASGNIMALLNFENPSLTLTDANEYAFQDLFCNCTALTSAPSLPATTLATSCYEEMFSECTSLTSVPDLPATTLANKCYKNMFSSCESLTQAPDLPATTLAEESYSNMFCGCTSLTEAPEIKATTLADLCCMYMFEECTSLTEAPELKATTLTFACYAGMFCGCTSLTEAPELKATTLADGCYAEMFCGCSSLSMEETTDASKAIWVMPSSTEAEEWGDAMLEDTTGPATEVEIGKMYKVASNLPNYVKFEGTEEFTIKLRQLNYAPAVTLQYSIDGTNWIDYANKTRPTISSGENKVVYFRGTNNAFSNSPASNSGNYFYITTTNNGTVAASGNIMALLNYENPSTTLTNSNDYAFFQLFAGCEELTQAPSLPATTLSSHCYMRMFVGCTSLAEAPELPATTLAGSCYKEMFGGCKSLTSAPELPASKLEKKCYENMFNQCINLTSVPELKATTLTDRCYANMFNGCTNLKMEETTDASEALWVMPSSTEAEGWNDNTLIYTAGSATSVELGKMYKLEGDTEVYPYMVGETGYKTAADLNKDIADGTVEEGSTIVLTGEKPDGTVVLDGKDMTIDGSALDAIVLPDNGVLVSVTDKARVNVLGTMPATAKDNTADAPIYSEGFIYLGADASSKTLTTTGSVYQAKTVAEFMTAAATLTESIALSVSAEVALKTGDVIAIAAKEGTAGATTFNQTTGFYEATISGIYLSHIGNDLGLSVKANDTAAETVEDYTTVNYLSDAATADGTAANMKTLIANLIVACKYINDVGEGNKGAAIDLTAEDLGWIDSAKTTEAPAKKSMTINTSTKDIRFAAAGIHVTDKLNLFVEITPRGEATEIPKGTYIKTYINDGNGYVAIDAEDSSVFQEGKTQWYAYIDKITPTQYNSDIKVVLYTKDNELAQTLFYSVNTYCYNMSGTYSDLCTAIYNYGTAAKAVAAPQ